MPSTEKLDTHHKALTLNLDTTTFGSFAEIGAGQEVARWFLVVGGASGTVAKTISAYDKEVSDDLYGSGSRYVSKQRLEAMLDNNSSLPSWKLTMAPTVPTMRVRAGDREVFSMPRCPSRGQKPWPHEEQ